MSTTGRRGTAAAARLLSMLAVVIGLLAMHGLASTHHAALPGHATAAGAGLLLPQDPGGAHRHGHDASGSLAAVATAVGLLDAAGVGSPAPACGDDCLSGLAVLCAAVLAGVAVTAWLVAATARRAVLPASARSGSRPRAPDAARQLLPGPDLVAGLCVSRT